MAQESDFQQLSERDHILSLPSRYLGHPKKMDECRLVYDETGIHNAILNTPEAVIQTFKEPFSNMADSIIKSRNKGFEVPEMEVDIGPNVIRMRNGGMGIPLDIHKVSGLWTPDLIFGHLRTGSNFQTSEKAEDRYGAGRHGEGVKLVNVFSKSFSVEIGDKVRKRRYYQLWTDNMGETEGPQVYGPLPDGTQNGDDYEGENYVEVTYELDLARFKMKKYDELTINHFACLCVNLSYTLGVPIRFWNRTVSDEPMLFHIQSPEEFGALYFPVVEQSDMIVFKDERCEIIFGNTTGDAVRVGIANHLITPAGGGHVDKVLEIVGAEFIERAKKEYVAKFGGKKAANKADKILKAKREKRENKGKGRGKKTTAEEGDEEKPDAPVGKVPNSVKGKKAAAKKKVAASRRRGKGNAVSEKDAEELLKKAAHLFTIAKIKQHLSFIMICNIPNPDWDGGQIKSALKEYPYDIAITKEIFENMLTWNFNCYLLETISKKLADELKKTDGWKAGRVRLRIGEQEAGNAPCSKTAFTFLVEGKSAAQLPKELRGMLENGTEKFGYLPLRGKPGNPLGMSVKRLEANQVMNFLKKWIGIGEGVDYTKQVNFDKLRYGLLIILADQDNDGKHIMGLVCNIFHVRWPSLIKRGFLATMETPRYVGLVGKKRTLLYTDDDRDQYLRSYPKAKIQYRKGLASNKKEDIEMIAADPQFRIITIDSKTNQLMKMAFDPKLADLRKEWMLNTKIMPEPKTKKLNLSQFINTSFLEFCEVNLLRSIPSLMDGVKPSQRKAIYTALERWGYALRSPEEAKVMEFATDVMKRTQYHYGPTSITDAIVRMAWEIVGKNNLNYFVPAGLFGSRDMGGKDAGAVRYVETCPMPYLGSIFRKEDEPLLELIDVDNKKGEPKFMLPIIPMALINGVEGIGTGWSTFIPNFNPFDVIDAVISILKGEEMKPLIPWYRGFTGEITLTRKKAKKSKGEQDEAEEEKEEEEEEEERPAEPEEIEAIEKEAVGKPDEDPESKIKEMADEDEAMMEDHSHLVMTSTGIYEKLDNGDIVVTELPIGRWTYMYREMLLDMEEDGDIKKVKDRSTADGIHFTLQGVTGKVDEKFLHLRKSVGLTKMTLIGPDNKPMTFDTPEQIVEAFVEIRLPWYTKRKEAQLEAMRKKYENMGHKIEVISMIATTDKTIKVKIMRRKKVDVIAELGKKGASHPEVFSQIKAENFTEEEIAELEEERTKLAAEIEQLDVTDPRDIWMQELEDLRKKITPHMNSAPNPGKKGKGRGKKGKKNDE